MSEISDTNKKSEPGQVNQPDSNEEQSLAFHISRSGDQLKIQDPKTGKIIVLNARMEPEEEETKDQRPIPPDEFRTVLRKLDEIGIAWTAGIIPGIKVKEGQAGDPLNSPEFLQITEQYPYLPYELGAITGSVLMGKMNAVDTGMDEAEFIQKAAIVKEIIITPEYRSEFFFTHSIKVPHFVEVDWEVVIKAYEMNVNNRPDITYGILSLILHSSEARWGRREKTRQTITVAVNDRLVDKLISSLQKLKKALGDAKTELEETCRLRSAHDNQQDN